MTMDLFNAVFHAFTEMLSFTRIMDLYQLSECSVRSVFDAIEIKPPAELPETICIDEFHADTGFYMKKRKKWATDDYNVNLTDWKRRTVIDVLQQKNLVFLSKHFNRHYTRYQRFKFRFFVCDMSGSFISLAKNCFPKALICIDNFNLIERLEKAVTNVRVRSQNRLRDSGHEGDYKLLKNLHYILMTPHSLLTMIPANRTF